RHHRVDVDVKADDQRRYIGRHFGVKRTLFGLDRSEARAGRPAREDRAVVKTWDLLLGIAVGNDGYAGAALRNQRVELCAPPLRSAESVARGEQARDRRLRIAQAVGDAVEPAVERRSDDRPAPDPPSLFARSEAEVARLGAAGLLD